MNESVQDLPARAVDDAILSRPEAGHVFRTLAALRSACVLYPENHPAIEAQIDDVHRHMSSLLAGQADVRLDIIRGTLSCDGEPLTHESRIHARVLDEFVALGVDSLHLTAGVDREEIRALGQFLAHEHAGPGTGQPIVDRLGKRGIRSISLGRILPISHRLRDELPHEPEHLFDDDYRESADMAQAVFADLEGGRAPGVGEIRSLLESLLGKVARSSVALSQVMALKRYENRSYLHSVNVALLAIRLGERLGMDKPDLMALAEAALLHDVGKTRIPVAILTKPGRPTDAEWRTIRRHPLMGAEILAELDGLGPLTPIAALEHHVDYLGPGGYPDLGPDRRPHAVSQMVAVVDVYESLTGARTYRDPATPDDACLVLARMAGEKLNPALVKAFVSVVTFFPVGSVVRTTRDEVAVVVATHEDDALHPTVVRVNENLPYAPPGPRIDLRERDAHGAFLRDVVESISPDQHDFDIPRILGDQESDEEL